MRLARNSLIPSINHHRLLAFLFSINRCCFLIRQLVNSTRESYSVNPGTSVKLFLLERYRKIIEKKIHRTERRNNYRFMFDFRKG